MEELRKPSHGETTISRAGEYTITIRTTGHDKGRVSQYSKNSWTNEDLTKDWISCAWGLLNFLRRLLVWDAYRCHIMDYVSNHARRNANSDISVIPGGLTGHLQPPDVSWNNLFQQAYKGLHND